MAERLREGRGRPWTSRCTSSPHFRAVGDDRRVTLDIDFDTPSQADSFLSVLRNDVWSSSEKAPAKLGTPSAQIIDLVESHEYR